MPASPIQQHCSHSQRMKKHEINQDVHHQMDGWSGVHTHSHIHTWTQFSCKKGRSHIICNTYHETRVSQLFKVGWLKVKAISVLIHKSPEGMRRNELEFCRTRYQSVARAAHRLSYIHSLVEFSLCFLIFPQVVRKGVEIGLPLSHKVLLVIWTP